MRDLAVGTFGQQHVDDVFGGAVSEQLTFVLLVIRNTVLVHQRDEIGGREFGQCRTAELRVLADEVFVRRAHIQIAIGEIAATTARDADLLGHLLRVVQEQHRQATLPGLGRTEQTGRAELTDPGPS